MMTKPYPYAFFFFTRRRRHTRFDCDWSSDVCSSDLPDGPVWLGQPHRPIRGAIAPDEPDPAQKPVDDAELGVVHPLPGQHADADRQRERNHDQAAYELPSPEGLEQEEREGRAEKALENGTDHREDDAVLEGDIEDIALQSGPEVLQANEVRDGGTDVGVAQGQVHREDEGRTDEQQNVENRGSQQKVTEAQSPGGLTSEPSRSANPGGDRNGSGPGACRVRAAARRA